MLTVRRRALAVDVHVGRCRGHGVAAVGGRWKLFDVGLNQCQRVLCDIALVRDHQRHGLADERHLLAGEDERPDVRRQHVARELQRQAIGGQHGAKIGEGEDGMHAGKCARPPGVDVPDQAMGDRAAQEGGVEQAWWVEVIDKAAGAAKQRRILCSRIAPPDISPARHRQWVPKRRWQRSCSVAEILHWLCMVIPTEIPA
jgi:hypothetical protein